MLSVFGGVTEGMRGGGERDEGRGEGRERDEGNERGGTVTG